MSVTPEERAEWRRLADAATTGPWEAYGITVAARTDPGDCMGCSGLLSPAHLPENHIVEVAEANIPDARFIAAAREAVPALLDALDAADAELDRLHSWRGLMELLDEHYPEDIFPTGPDSAGRDFGPRIVSLMRNLDAVRAERDEALAAIERVRDRAGYYAQLPHSEDCSDGDCARHVGDEILSDLDGAA